MQLDELNPDQRRAVEHRDGPLVIVAGPGSGKTRVMTHRIAHLIATGVTPEAILAITFTNKAAEEMRRRTLGLLDAALSAGERVPLVSTFHSFCARLLRREIYRLSPYRIDYGIYDTEDQKSVVEQALARLELDKSTFPPRACMGQISSWKNHMVSPEEAFDAAETHRTRQFARIFQAYQTTLAERNALDFDDLLLLTLRILRECPEALARRRREHRYLLIDEFQDTNRPQYNIARLLAQEHGNLCITGDPDQSIYSWRGASPENFDEFREDFPGYTVIHLNRNYRSTPEIVLTAQRLTSTQFGDRSLFTDNPSGDQVIIHRVGDERKEAQEALHRILEWQHAGVPLGEIAVLYRINAQSRPIEDELIRARVPYVIVGGTAFYQRKEVKDILCYLRAAFCPRDDLAFRRVVNTPHRGIGKVGFERFEDAALARGLSLGDALMDDAVIADIPSRSRSAFLQFRELLEEIRRFEKQPLHLQVKAAVETSGYAQYLEKTEPESWRDRAENLEELANAAAELEERIIEIRRRHPDAPDALHIFLEQVALATDVDRWNAQPDRVSLMTLHAAKGLEFDRVIVTGVEQSLLPHTRAEGETSDEEERRLFYVGITRARHSVVLLHAAWRRRFRDREPRLPSPFLDEIAGEGVHEERDAVVEEPQRYATVAGSDDVYADAYDDDELQKGVWLEHDIFGKGEVVGTSGFGDSKRVTVRFLTHGEKQLVAAYAPYRIIGRSDPF